MSAPLPSPPGPDILPAPRYQHVRSVYQRKSGRYDRYYRRAWLLLAGRAAERAMLAQLVPILAGRASPRVLDAGAGTGALSRELSRVLPSARPVLVDLSPAMLAKAADLHDPRAVADLAALPFPDAQFDVVMSAWVIETVDDPRAVVTEMLRVLRAGGLLVYSFCSRPGRRRDRWLTGPLRAVVHAVFAGHFLSTAQTPFHDCAVSTRRTFGGGVVTVVSLGTCCQVSPPALLVRAGRPSSTI